MDASYAHLLVNHFPVVLSLLALGGVLVAMLTGKPFYWFFGMLCAVLADIAVIPVFLTGRSARNVMEQIWYVSRTAVHNHEEAGEWALWIVLASGVVSGYALWRFTRPAREGKDPFPYWTRALVGIMAVLAATTTARTAFLGGKIVHESTLLKNPPLPSPDTLKASPGSR